MEGFQFSLGSYLKALYISILHPIYYSQIISQYKNTRNSLVFFIFNISLGLMIYIIKKVILAHNFSLIFPSISETLFWIPVSCIFLLILVLFLHLMAKIAGGRGKLSDSLAAACFSSLPLIFLGIPIISTFSWFWAVVLLILSFRRVHHYRPSKAVLNIALPFLLMLLLLIILGIINPSKMFSSIQNLA